MTSVNLAQYCGGKICRPAAATGTGQTNHCFTKLKFHERHRIVKINITLYTVSLLLRMAQLHNQSASSGAV
jgi:hypothetical protein